MNYHRFVLPACSLLLSSCASFQRDPVGALLEQERNNLSASLYKTGLDGRTELERRYHEAENSNSASQRNNLIWSLLHLIDTNYFIYEQRTLNNSSWFDFGSNTVNLGLTTASTLSGAEGVKTTLSALATVVTGTHSEFNRSVLRDQAIPAIIAKMRANRATKYVSIRGRLNENTDQYPVGEAMRDMLEYYQYGTIEGTFGEITKSAAQQETKADGLIEGARKDGGPEVD